MNSVAYEVHESLGLDRDVGVDRTLTYEVLYVTIKVLCWTKHETSGMCGIYICIYVSVGNKYICVCVYVHMHIRIDSILFADLPNDSQDL